MMFVGNGGGVMSLRLRADILKRGHDDGGGFPDAGRARAWMFHELRTSFVRLTVLPPTHGPFLFQLEPFIS
jgi:hypothetical protein